MVGELSPDGNFIWNGTDWEPVPSTEQVIPEEQNNNFLSANIQPQEIGWQPVSEKSDEGGKGKIIAMSVVGLLIATALGWLIYAFVIDPMLFPDDLTKDEFLSIANDSTNIEDVVSGDVEDWHCSVEFVQSDGFTVTTEYDYYASKNSARSISSMTIMGDEDSSDVWIDQSQIAWKMLSDGEDGKETETGKIDILGMNSTPSNELFNKTDSEIDACFIHNVVAASFTSNPSQMFMSGPERFPDEDGERAVKVATELELSDIDENETYTVSVYFDGDDNLLGSKIENSTFTGTIKLSSKSISKPGWVKSADTEVPLLLSVDPSDIWSASSNGTISTQFNATYSMDGAEVVLYTTEYDDDYNDVYEIEYRVDIETAMNEGLMIQYVDEWYGVENNCSLTFTDNEPLQEISTGDVISIDCDNYSMSDYDMGIANANGIAEEKDLSVPWISPFFTIIALLGAALIISRRES